MNAEQEKILIQLGHDMNDVLTTLKGSDALGFKQPGVIQRLANIEKKVDDHEINDEKKFDAVFKFQEHGMLLFGWSKWAITALFSGLIAFGGFLTWTITTLVALFK